MSAWRTKRSLKFGDASIAFKVRFALSLVITILIPVLFKSVQAQSAPAPVRVNNGAWDGSPRGHRIATFEKSFFLAAAEWNGNPIGFWSNGTTLWVGDWLFSKLFAYDLESFERDSERDFSAFAVSGNRSARGLWSDGQVMWVTDEFVDKVFAYDLITHQRLPELDIGSLISAGNESPTGIWSNGETILIADDGDDKIYAYDFATRLRDVQRDFDSLVSAGNTGIRDIWSDGKTLWVTDVGTWTAWGGWADGRVFAYDLSTQQRLPLKDLDHQLLREAGVKSPNAIWSDGESVWVGDRPQHRVFKFSLDSVTFGSEPLPGEERDLSFDITKLGGSGNANPSHLWSDGKVLWVTDNEDRMIYAYDGASRSRLVEFDLSLVEILGDRPYLPAGVWSDGVHIWLADWYTTHIFVFDLVTGMRQAELEIGPLSRHGNQDPAGMWSNGEVLWVLDTSDAQVYAYDLATSERRQDQELTGLAASGNSYPRGIWSDGESFWIGDWEEDRVFAYRLGAENRVPDLDLNGLVSAGNLSPLGLWSDGQRMWISDYADAQIYSYSLPGAEGGMTSPKDQVTPEIRMVRLTDGALRIEYAGTLMQSDRVEGPYAEVEGAVSPFIVRSNQEVRFFIAE